MSSPEETESKAVTDENAAPPAEAAPTETPAVEALPTEAPAAEAPAAEAPPSDAPPKEAPPTEAPPTEAPPPTNAANIEPIEVTTPAEAPARSASAELVNFTSEQQVERLSDTTTIAVDEIDDKRGVILDDEVLKGGLKREKEYSDSDSVDSVGSYILRKTLTFAPDFFEILGAVPDLDEISEDLSIIEIIDRRRTTMQTEALVVNDEGKFVDPVTGVPIEDEEEESEEAPAVEEEDEEEEEAEEEEGEDDDLLVAQEIEEDADLAKPAEEPDVFETFLEIEAEKKTVIESAVDWEALEREAAARRLQESTLEFIDSLITRVVEKCEYVDPNTLLREHLDKEKMMAEIEEKLIQYDVEQRTRSFLHRKTVEYFRRKKAFRSITEETAEVLQQETLKYKEAIVNLDCIMGKESETKESTSHQMETLYAELYECQQKCRDQTHTLEELMRKTLVRDNFERMKLVLDGLLSRMSKLRDEVSECRLILLQRLHTFAVLVEQLDKLEDLGNGLRMRDFEHLQTETQALGKKIEERNAELSKLRTRCNADLHIMAHMKEKQKMIRNTITLQETALQELVDEKQLCRERLYALKLARERARKEMRELSFQGGLLDKPALMLDYDDTSERLDKLRAKVEQMRIKYSDIQQKIQILEKRCEEKN